MRAGRLLRAAVAAALPLGVLIGALAATVPGGRAAADDRERTRARSIRPPEGDEVFRYPVKGRGNPGRVEFSHLRHFDALGEKACTTCHSPEMGLVTSPAYASRTSDPSLEPHGEKSIGRFCSTCHNGTTRLSQVGQLRGRHDAALFTAARTGDPTACGRCHAPRDHGADFTPAHGDVAEDSGGRPCLACHAQDFGPSDRKMQAELLAAEQVLKASPDDPAAARAVGPNNFCLYCHRTDMKWLEGD